MTSSNRALGSDGEAAVARYYSARGYRVLSQNWRCRSGELDLVLLCPQHKTIVFCEVKTRRSDTFGSPLEAVTTAKRRKLRRLAALWLEGALEEELLRSGAGYVKRPVALRFDVAAVDASDATLAVELVKAAF